MNSRIGIPLGWTRRFERPGPIRVSGRLQCVAVTVSDTSFEVTGTAVGQSVLRVACEGRDPEWVCDESMEVEVFEL